MANVKITDLPQINFSSITNNDVIPIVDVDTNTTSKVLISDLKSLFNIPFTGGTVSGNTTFQNGLTANTISATTYQNLPIDPNTYITGFSYNNNTFTISDNSGNTYDASFNDVTGLTVNGTLSATTISGGTFYGDGSNIDNITASGITYDNISSELSATTVQEAIDEIVEGEDLYYKGNYVNFAETAGGIVTTSTYVPGFLFGFPIYIRGNVGVEELRIFITSGVIGNIVFGLYNSLEGRPNEKVFQTTEFNTSITGVQTYTLPTVLKLKKGLYYVAYTSNSGPSTRIFTSTHGSAFVGEADASFAGATGLFSRVLTYNSTLPTLWGTPSTFNSTTAYPFSPYVQFKVAY